MEFNGRDYYYGCRNVSYSWEHRKNIEFVDVVYNIRERQIADERKDKIKTVLLSCRNSELFQ